MQPACYRDLRSGKEIYELLPDNQLVLIKPQFGEFYETSLGHTYLFGWTYEDRPGFGRGHLVTSAPPDAGQYQAIYKTFPRLFIL